MSKKIKISKKEFHKKCINSLSEMIYRDDMDTEITSIPLFVRLGSKICARLENDLFKKEDYRMKKRNILIKYFGDVYEGDKSLVTSSYDRNWIDLRASEDVFIEEGSFKLIPLGVAMKLPEGYEAHIVPRSSTFKTWGIIQTNSMGVIDESYCGDNDQWFFPAYCIEGKDVGSLGIRGTKIHRGDRICQFRIVKRQKGVTFTLVRHLSNADRGGHGSTGTN